LPDEEALGTVRLLLAAKRLPEGRLAEHREVVGDLRDAANGSKSSDDFVTLGISADCPVNGDGTLEYVKVQACDRGRIRRLEYVADLPAQIPIRLRLAPPFAQPLHEAPDIGSRGERRWWWWSHTAVLRSVQNKRSPWLLHVPFVSTEIDRP
jgi:hypothetical protein